MTRLTGTFYVRLRQISEVRDKAFSHGELLPNTHGMLGDYQAELLPNGDVRRKLRRPQSLHSIPQYFLSSWWNSEIFQWHEMGSVREA